MLMSLVMVALMLLAGGGSDTAKWAAVNRGKAGLQVISHRSHCSDTCITLFFFFSQLFISFSFNLSNKKLVCKHVMYFVLLPLFIIGTSITQSLRPCSKPPSLNGLFGQKKTQHVLFFLKRLASLFCHLSQGFPSSFLPGNNS